MFYEKKREKISEIIDLMKENKFRDIFHLFENDENYREPLLVWIRPSKRLVEFIEKEVTSIGIHQISSVGCGCGTLEWLIQASTNLEVTGYEVNKSWWESPYSTPHFIKLEYVDENDSKRKLPADSALMFCYFNNNEYFHTYLNNFTGKCVILIGPIDGSRHCDPEPSYLENFSQEWKVKSRLSIQGGDEIVIYQRS